MASWRKEIKETLSLGVPMAFAQISQTLMSTTDVALVGRLQGEALAAMAVGQAAHGFFLSLGIGLIAAVGPLVSQAHGAGNEKSMAHSVVMGTCTSVLLALIFWPILYHVNSLFTLLGYTQEMNVLATSYTRALMLSLPFAFFFLTQKSYLDSISRPRWPMTVALIGILVNGLADYALIYGYWGFPALGVQGTGYATTVVNLFMALALLPITWKKSFSKAFVTQKWSEWKEFLEVGLPIAGSIGIEVGLFVVGALMMGRLGPDEAAAHQIVLVCAATTFMIPLGISFAGSTRVGQAIGRRDFKAVRPGGLAAIFVGTSFMALTALAFLLTPATFIDLFWDPASAKSSQVQTFAMEMLLIAGIFQLADGLQVTALGALRGMKDVKVPLLIAGFCYWVVGLGSAVYLTFYTDLRHQGLWIGFLLGLGTASLAMTFRFLKLSSQLCHDPELQRQVTVEGISDESPGS